MYKHILIPIDESALSTLVIERGVELARTFGARACFLYLHPDAGKLVDGDAGLLHAMAPALFARKYLWADGYVEAKARAWARMHGVEADFVGGLGKGKIHEGIIATAQARGADLIVVGSHGRGMVVQRLIDSVTVKLILHSPLPVFVAETGVVPETIKSRVIACFREEHAAWLALADRLVAALSVAPARLDSGLIDDALALLARFASEVHGPKEAQLLAALHASGGNEAELERIRAQHDEEPIRFDALLSAWRDRERLGPAQMVAAADAWRAFVATHLRDENHMLLLRADDVLSGADWERVGATILDAGQRSQSVERQDAFRALFARFEAVAA